LRKRDPRYKAHLSQQATQTASTRENGASADTARVRAAATETYVEQAWQTGGKDSTAAHVDLEWAVAEGTDDEEWECVACGKSFRSEAAWEAHERSKKHIREIERLQREMLAEEEELGLGEEQIPASDSDNEQVKAAIEEPVDEVANVGEENEVQPRSPIRNTNDITPPVVNIDDSDSWDGPSRRKKGRKVKKGRRPPSPTEPATKTERRTAHMLDGVEDETLPPKTTHQRTRVPSSDPASPAPGEDASAEPHGIPADLTQPTVAPELTKREKRRAKEALKKAQESMHGTLVCFLSMTSSTHLLTDYQTCNVCNEPFDSKTKLFSHIKETGHAAAESGAQESSGSRKGKKGKR
jgi:DnaJ homolog subfamily A member 5